MAIYDCFTFFNEFEILELRLSSLYNVVDYFVLVESNKTHKNIPKEYNFEKMKNRFAKYADKIRYIKENDVLPYKGKDDWTIENHQRNCIMKGLYDAQPEDYIFISDVDEIPNPDLVEGLKNNQFNIHFFGHKTILDRRLKKYRRINRIKFSLMHPSTLFHPMNNLELLSCSPIVCEQKLYYYYLNCQSAGMWYGTILVLFKNLKTPQKLRDIRNRLPRVENAGWHFSYMGGFDRIVLKLNSIVEGDEKKATKANVENCLKYGVDLYGRQGSEEYKYEFCEINSIGLPGIEQFIGKYPHYYCSKK